MISGLKVALTSLVLGAMTVRAAVDENIRMGNRTIERTVQLRTHSIYAPYIDQDLQNRWWDFGADAYVNTNKHIRLTRSRPSQMGWLWSRLPVTAANFIVEVEFKVSGDSTHLFGDGFAMWLTKTRAQPGPVFGSVDNFEGLALIVDTYANSRHAYSFPRILAINGDGKTSYDSHSDGDAQALGGCSANIRRTNVATKLKLTYLKDEFLDVKIQYKAWDDWSDCFQVKGISLPTAPFLGFSALTGDVFDAHDIIAVTTSSAILSAADAPRDRLKPAIPLLSGEDSLLSSTFVRIILFAGLCAGGFYGYKYYVAKQRQGSYSGSFGGNSLGGSNGFGHSGGFGGDMYGKRL